MVAAGHDPMSLKRGIDRAVEAISAELKNHVQADQGSQGNRAGRHHLGQQRLDHRRHHCRGDGESRQGRRHHGGRGARAGDPARSGRGYAVRPRLPVAVLRDRSGADGSEARRRVHPDPREEDFLDEGPAADPRDDCQDRQAVPDHRRGYRRRGAGDAGRQQDSRHAVVRRGQGAGLRRSAQGDARRYRDPDRRPRDFRRARTQARERARSTDLGRAKRLVVDKDNTHDYRWRRQEVPTSRVASSRFARRSRRPPRTTIARSCRSGSRSWSAASR